MNPERKCGARVLRVPTKSERPFTLNSAGTKGESETFMIARKANRHSRVSGAYGRMLEVLNGLMVDVTYVSWWRPEFAGQAIYSIHISISNKA